MKQEKRRVQRIMLESPLAATFAKQAVTIIDLSTTGARIEHPTPMAGRKVMDLRFSAGGVDLVVSCELVRCRLQRSSRDRSTIVYSSGLRFVDPSEESRSAIRSLVASLVQDRGLEEPSSPAALSLAV